MREHDRPTGKEKSEVDLIREGRVVPEGVSPMTFQFLRQCFELRRERALNILHETIVGRYFATDMTFKTIEDDVKRKVLRTNFFAAMDKLWQSMPLEERAKFPKSELELLKDKDKSQTREEQDEEKLFYGDIIKMKVFLIPNQNIR